MKPKIGMLSMWAFPEQIAGGIVAGGGIPVLIPLQATLEIVPDYIAMIDGLLVPGGEDVTPYLYGQDPHSTVDLSLQDKDEFDLALIREAMAQNKPIFGICRGMQILNVALGGTLIQDIPSQVENAICHRQNIATQGDLFHRIYLEEGGLLEELFGQPVIEVNSFHHQAIDRLADGLVISARAADGIIEGVTSQDGRIFAIQCHPETLWANHPQFIKLFAHLVDLCKNG